MLNNQSVKKIPITAKASISYIICNIVQKGLLIITLPIFTRLLTTDQYGQVVLYSSWRVLFTVLITLNVAFGSFPKAMLRYEDDRDGYVSTCQGVCLCLSILFLLIYLVFREYINILVELPTFIVIIMVLEIIGQSSISLLCAKKRFEYKYKDVIIVTLASSLISPFLAYFLVRNLADKGFAMIIGYAIPTILVGFIVFVINLYKGKKILTSKYCKYIIGLNIPLLVYYLSQMIFNHSDKIMISHITGPSDAALYGLAYSIAMVLTFVLDSVNGSYVPWLYERIKTKEYQKNRKISTMIAAALSLMLLGIIWFAPEFVYIFGGEKYSASVYCIPALTISLLLLYYSQLFVNVQFYYENKNSLIIATIISALINIVLNWILIPIYGFIIASYTTLLSYFILTICNYFAVKKISKKEHGVLNLYEINKLIFIFILFSCIAYIGSFLYGHFLIRFVIAFIVLLLLLIFRKIIYQVFLGKIKIERCFNYVLNLLFYPIRYRYSLFKIKNVRKEMAMAFKKKKIINVIFLIQSVETWTKICDLYFCMLKNQIFNPIIVCVPSDYTKFDIMNHLDNDVYDYFIRKGYNAINAIDEDNKWIDLDKLNPMYIFHSRPYNNYMPHIYRTGVLKNKYLIANIPYGGTLSSSICKIVLNNDYYKDVFCFFSLDNSEKDIYENKFNLGINKNIQKCESLGKIGLEYVLHKKTNVKHTRRKVVWTPRWNTSKNTGGSNFLEYKDVLLDLASSYQDVDFVFRPHPLTFNYFIENGIMTYKEVEEFKHKCETTSNVILDEGKEYVDTFWPSDLLISDFSSVVLEYFITKKPIIYCLPKNNIIYTKFGEDVINTLYHVRDKNELVEQFTCWYNGLDNKKKIREKMIDELDIEGSSENILDRLVKYLDIDN